MSETKTTSYQIEFRKKDALLSSEWALWGNPEKDENVAQKYRKDSIEGFPRYEFRLFKTETVTTETLLPPPVPEWEVGIYNYTSFGNRIKPSVLHVTHVSGAGRAACYWYDHENALRVTIMLPEDIANYTKIEGL